MKNQLEIEAECDECGGTGLYEGMCEPEGVAVVCIRCGGTGCRKIQFKPFKGRKPKRGVKTVMRSGGRFLVTGVGPVGKAITYREFKDGKMP